MYFRTINGRTYFAYSYHRSRDAADDALESYFANGEICASERPEIVTTPKSYVDAARFAVMFPG